MTPEQQQQLLALVSSGDQDPLVQQQLAQAQSLMQGSGKRYSSTLGALGGGLADVLNAYRGTTMQQEAQGKQQSALDAKAKARQAFLDAMNPQPVAAAPGAALGKMQQPGGMGGAPDAQGLMGQALQPKPVDPRIQQLQTALFGAASGDPFMAKMGGFQLQQAEADRARQAELEQMLAKARLSSAEKDRDYARTLARDDRLDKTRMERARVLARQGQDIATEREERADQRKKQAQVVEIEERYRGINKALDDIEANIKRSGTFELTGPQSANMEALITSYATDMAKLRDAESVAREAEVENEKKGFITKSPFTRDETALAVLKEARKRVQQRRDEAYRVRGLEVPPAAKPEPPAASTAGQAPTPNEPEALELDGVTFIRQANGTYKPKGQ